MSHSKLMPLGFLFVLVAAALVWAPQNATLQAEQPAATADESDEASDSAARKKPRGRLPVFYSQVVSGDQREEIYQIQARYAPEMDELVEKLVELRNQMQEEIQGVLTPEQVARVQELRDEAKKRRAERAAARTDSAE